MKKPRESRIATCTGFALAAAVREVDVGAVYVLARLRLRCEARMGR
jgi:hypothetical protein